MKFKKFAATILAILGLTEWEKEEGKATLTDDQVTALQRYGFTEKFLGAFKEALANDFQGEDETAETEGNTRQALLQGLLADTTARLTALQEQLENMQNDKAADVKAIAAKDKELATLRDKVKALAAAAEEDPGKGAMRPKAGGVTFDLNDDKQLGGMPGEMYALDRPYNQRARAALLSRHGHEIISQPMAQSIDYTRLTDDLGAFYRIPWQDRLQSFLMQLPTVESIFPLQSGYQDLATLVNIWLGEFSQADNTASDFDNVTKGQYEFDDETLRMFDVMFAHKFKNLKALEKTWIGSLNKEGSQVIKWSFIEFILAETAKKLHNEREQRRINGVRKNPTLNTPGRAMEAADGLYEWLRKKIDGYTDIDRNSTVYQIKPFELGEITEANIGEKIYQGTGMIPAVLRDSGSLALYMPSYMVVLYHKYNELLYGKNQDYKADIMYVKEYPSVRIIPVPNADNHCRIFWTMEGNVQTFEHNPGEMISFNIEQQDWTLKVWSNWKESIWAVAVGFKYTSKDDMDYSRQMIFANEYDLSPAYFIEAPKDDNPDVAVHNSVVTVPNTSKYSITDIKNAQVGQIITLKCGSTNYGVQIAASGKFSLLSEAWDPAKGDTIQLMKRSDGKFIEVARTPSAYDVLYFTADDTTPSVKNGNEFTIGTNTEATAITNLDDANVGEKYVIHGAGSTYASTIANSGNFVLTEAMTLSSGHSITLVAAKDGKFYELART